MNTKKWITLQRGNKCILLKIREDIEHFNLDFSFIADVEVFQELPPSYDIHETAAGSVPADFK